MPALTPDLLTAYQETTYQVFWPDNEPIALKIGQIESPFFEYLTIQGISCFAILTAWNPGSELLPDAENQQRNRLMEALLMPSARLILPAVNVSADGSWPMEFGFCVCDISRTEAVNTAARFGQHALVWWEKGAEVELVVAGVSKNTNHLP